jgi:hypothetical protein
MWRGKVWYIGTFETIWHHQIFREVVGLEWDPLSLVSTTEELLGRNSIGSLKTKNKAMGIHCNDHRTPSICKMALPSPTSGSRSVGIVRSRTKGTEFFFHGITSEEVAFTSHENSKTQTNVTSVNEGLRCTILRCVNNFSSWNLLV